MPRKRRMTGRGVPPAAPKPPPDWATLIMCLPNDQWGTELLTRVLLKGILQGRGPAELLDRDIGDLGSAGAGWDRLQLHITDTPDGIRVELADPEDLADEEDGNLTGPEVPA